MSLILIGQHGRLGNQLWTYANVLSFALSLNRHVINVPFVPFSRLFEGAIFHGCTYADNSLKFNRLKYDLVRKHLAPILYKVNLRLAMVPTLDVGESLVLDLDQSRWWFENRKHIFLSGLYLVAPVSLAMHQNNIRAFFRPVVAVRRPAEEIIDSPAKERRHRNWHSCSARRLSNIFWWKYVLHNRRVRKCYA